MFKNLGSKLNGAKLGASGTPGSSGGNHLDQNRKSNNMDTGAPSVVTSSHAGPSGGTASQGFATRTIEGGNLGPGPTISRQSNPFAKGFSALRSEGTSFLKPSTTSQNTSSSRRQSSSPTIETSRNHPTTAGWSNGASGNATNALQGIHQQMSEKAAATTSAPVSEANTSFDAEDFFTGSDELALADLMDDLEEEKGSEDEPPLSWTPTPPRDPKATSSSAPSSQISQISISSQQAAASRAVNASYSNTSNGTMGAIKSEKSSVLSVSTHPTTARSMSPTPGPKKMAPKEMAPKEMAPKEMAPKEMAPYRKTTGIIKSLVGASSASFSRTRVLPEIVSGSSSTRPNERDTIGSRGAVQDQGQPTIVRKVQDQERRVFSRSHSSPSAGSSPSIPSRNKRRLPGPAGNLPRLSAEEKEQLFRSRGVPFGKDVRASAAGSISPNTSIKRKMKAVHRGPVDGMFANGAWEEMLRTYRLPDYKPSTLTQCKGAAPLLELSLSDIENREDLHRGKVSGLVVMIKEVALSEIDAAVMLMDPSGEMRGTVHRTVLEHYKNNEIRVGTVLALTNISVFSPTPISHYLIITLRNILGLFLPHPSNALFSQDSSQDRLSQKRRRVALDSQESAESRSSSSHSSVNTGAGSSSRRPNGSQEPFLINSSPATSDPASQTRTSAGRRRSLSPEWENIHDGGETARGSSSYPNTASLERLNRTMTSGASQERVKSQSSNQSKESVFSNIGAKGPWQDEANSAYPPNPREVQFQSLRPTMGGASIAPVQGHTQLDDLLPTPMITLGAMTPDLSSTSNPGASGRSLLASFAAPMHLRKRSSPLTLSQRSNSAGSTSDAPPGMVRDPTSVSSSHAPNMTPPASSKGSMSLLSPASAKSHSHGSLDWPDDFGDDDLVGVLEDDLGTSNGSRPAEATRMSAHPFTTNVTRTSALSRSSSGLMPATPRQPVYRHGNDDEDDDLDNLLDGLDETELYDL